MGFMMSDLKNNYWAMGIELTRYFEKNAEELGLKKVGMVADIKKISSQTTPAVYIVNTQNDVPSTAEHIDNIEAQRWTVVIAVSHANAQLQISDLMIKSGGIVGNILGRIRDFNPEGLEYHTPLKRVKTSGRPILYNSFGLYPFTFETTFSI